MSRTPTIIMVGLLMAAATALNAQSAFKSNLDEAQAGGTGSLASGTSILILNSSMTELDMTLDFDGLVTTLVTACHIHEAPVGQNGPVVFGLVAPNHDNDGDFEGVVTGYISEWDVNDGGSLLADKLPQLMNAELYFNVHTAMFPGGEIRGQIIPVLTADVNLDGEANLLDVAPFVDQLSLGTYQVEADTNFDRQVDLLDVAPFVSILSSGG